MSGEGGQIVKALQGSLMAGVVAGLGAAFILGETGNVNLAGFSVPISVALGTAVMVGDAVSVSVAPFILGEIPLLQRFQKLETGLISAGVSGGISVMAVNLLIANPMASNMNLFLLGAGSSFVGGSLNEMLASGEGLFDEMQ